MGAGRGKSRRVPRAFPGLSGLTKGKTGATLPVTERLRGMDESCLFCRIARREIETQVLFEDDHVLAFPDINPQAPVHILLIPKQHIATTDDFRAEHGDLLARLMLAATKVGRDQGLNQDGYRLVMNCQEGAGQSVFHVHMHLLGGRRMTWPPG